MEEKTFHHVSKEEDKILQYLKHQINPMSVDTIAYHTGLSIGETKKLCDILFTEKLYINQCDDGYIMFTWLKKYLTKSE